MSADVTPGAVGYVLKKFPVLSETFILNELLALEAQGVPVHVFSLERPNDPRYHEDLPKLMARISYLPDLSDPRRFASYGRKAAQTFGRRYYRTLGYALATGQPAMVWRFLQSCYIANEAKRLKLRHLHAHFANRPTSVAQLASRIAGVPFSFTAHATDIFKVGRSRRAIARKIEDSAFVVAISEYNRQFLSGLPGASDDRIVRINNGIDLSRFSPNGLPAASPFTFICVARLVEKKGLPYLIEACRLLRDRGVDFRCLMVGKGAGRSQLERMIRQWKLGDSVLMLGPKTQLQVRDLYRSAHAYVLPCVVATDGNREGLPVSIVEALACGLPVITTPVTGIPEVVRHEHNGLLCPERDASALAMQMERLISDSRLCATLGANARTSVATDYDLHTTVVHLRTAFGVAAA